MMTTPTEQSRDKQLELFELPKSQFYSFGVRRIIEVTARKLRLHDATFKRKDKRLWQTGYSLFRHHEMDRQVVSLMSSKQGLSRFETFISELAAQLHDTGKLDKECWVYRLNRKLSPMEKMAIDTHSARTGLYVKKMKKYMCSEDYSIIDLVYPVASSHHRPFLIKDSKLRQIGFNLKFADMLVSRTENRDRPGIPTFMAVEAIKVEMESLKSDSRYTPFACEMERSFTTIVSLFG
ncbi:MAG: hypothetical protein ACYCY6_01890 [Minisyncoccota bacterium]